MAETTPTLTHLTTSTIEALSIAIADKIAVTTPTVAIPQTLSVSVVDTVAADVGSISYLDTSAIIAVVALLIVTLAVYLGGEIRRWILSLP